MNDLDPFLGVLVGLIISVVIGLVLLWAGSALGLY